MIACANTPGDLASLADRGPGETLLSDLTCIPSRFPTQKRVGSWPHAPCALALPLEARRAELATPAHSAQADRGT